MFNQIKVAVLLLILVCVTLNCRAELVDPTRPPNDQQTIAAINKKFILTSILIAPHRQVAIINDQILKVGDSIVDYVVIKIEPKTVILKQADGSTVTLQLLNNVVKQQIFPHVENAK